MSSIQAPRHIAIAGNIGAGKTTLVQKLAAHYRWKALLEAVDHNPYLEDFYEDMKAWAFPLQIFFLHSRFNQMIEIRRSPQTIIQDRTIHEDAHIFARNLRESGYLSERDYQNYFSLYQSMSSVVEPPDLLIYLRASVPRLIEQIARRGRAYESAISIGYLQDLNRLYEEWIAGYTDGKVMIIDIEHLNYLDDAEDFGKILQRIEGELFGLF
ncbi:MAG: deoxynucleoside kinase [Bacteroidetes bacterium]|nr:MAG: deoxynucleoside kinase [Bacteroidota bacterium]